MLISHDPKMHIRRCRIEVFLHKTSPLTRRLVLRTLEAGECLSAFKKGAEAKGHQVEIVRIMEKNIGFCRACDGCMRNGGICVLKDDMAGPDEDFY